MTNSAPVIEDALGSTGPDGRRRSAPRVLFVLSGLHRVPRGAEIAFESIAARLATECGCLVTVIGSGPPRPDQPYDFRQVECKPRTSFSRWPNFPMLRNECAYEELTFAWRLARAYDPSAYDVTVSCSFPYTNWLLRSRRSGGSRPAHVFITQNGDWPAFARNSEFRFFSCEGLVCTSPLYFERNRDRWFSTLIPNGVDPDVFRPGPGARASFELPEDRPVALMVSALISSKRVMDGIRCAARLPDLHLVVAGDGPERADVESLGGELMEGRFSQINVDHERMPELYRSADVFLHMSLDEPSANAYVEAVASGLPVVTHDRSVTRWTFEDTAVLVDTTDEPAVVEGLRRALELTQAAHVRSRRELVERRFDWCHLADEYRAFLDQVIERHARSATTHGG